MLTPLIIKAKSKKSAQHIFAEKLAEMNLTGWEMLGTPQRYETDNGYVISVQMTPKRKDESDV